MHVSRTEERKAEYVECLARLNLTAEQRRFAEEALFHLAGISILKGNPGSGKTYVLCAVAHAYASTLCCRSETPAKTEGIEYATLLLAADSRRLYKAVKTFVDQLPYQGRDFVFIDSRLAGPAADGKDPELAQYSLTHKIDVAAKQWAREQSNRIGEAAKIYLDASVPVQFGREVELAWAMDNLVEHYINKKASTIFTTLQAMEEWKIQAAIRPTLLIIDDAALTPFRPIFQDGFFPFKPVVIIVGGPDDDGTMTDGEMRHEKSTYHAVLEAVTSAQVFTLPDPAVDPASHVLEHRDGWRSPSREREADPALNGKKRLDDPEV